MVFLAAGWAVIVTFLLLASEPADATPFIVTLVLLIIMVSLRSYLHFREETRLEAWLDVVLSILLSAVSLVYLGNAVLIARFYIASWQDVLDPQVLFYAALNLVLLVPFAVLSVVSLYRSLRHVRKA